MVKTNRVVAYRDEILHGVGFSKIEIGCCSKSIDGTWKGIGRICCQGMRARRAEKVDGSIKHSQLGSSAC